jgi:hypothetical protein
MKITQLRVSFALAFIVASTIALASGKWVLVGVTANRSHGIVKALSDALTKHHFRHYFSSSDGMVMVYGLAKQQRLCRDFLQKERFKDYPVIVAAGPAP